MTLNSSGPRSHLQPSVQHRCISSDSFLATPSRIEYLSCFGQGIGVRSVEATGYCPARRPGPDRHTELLERGPQTLLPLLSGEVSSTHTAQILLRDNPISIRVQLIDPLDGECVPLIARNVQAARRTASGQIRVGQPMPAGQAPLLRSTNLKWLSFRDPIQAHRATSRRGNRHRSPSFCPPADRHRRTSQGCWIDEVRARQGG